MARSSQPSKSSSNRNYAKRGRDNGRKGKSQSRSASKSQSRTRSTGSRAGPKGRSTATVRARSRSTIQSRRGTTQPRKAAAAGQASAAKSRTAARPVATKRRRANDDSKPVKPKRKMSAYNVFVREQLTGSPDVKDSMKDAAERWKKMSLIEKNRYKLDSKDKPAKKNKGTSKPGIGIKPSGISRSRT